MIEHDLLVPAETSGIDTFLTHPERHGPWPVVVFLMDAPGIREELRMMARRIATAGYAVALPNLYYREGPGTAIDMTGMTPESPAFRRMGELMRTLDTTKVSSDVGAVLRHLANFPGLDTATVGVVGYCMSGPFVLAAAAHYPEIKAAASFYGVGMATERPDSPHREVGRIKGELYAAFAELDRYAPLEEVRRLAEALAAAGTVHEVEVYPEVDHGFAFPERHAYDRAAAERHWERLHALFRRRLGR